MSVQIIRQKTASLIRAACVCGTKSNTDDPTYLQVMHQFGEHIGIAFQIKDDLMDLSNDKTGKPKIADIKEKKMTLPLITALNAAPLPKKNQMMSLIRNHNEREKSIQEVVQFIHDFKGVEKAQFKMYEYRDMAIELLKQLPQNAANEALFKLCHFVTEREK